MKSWVLARLPWTRNAHARAALLSTLYAWDNHTAFSHFLLAGVVAEYDVPRRYAERVLDDLIREGWVDVLGGHSTPFALLRLHGGPHR